MASLPLSTPDDRTAAALVGITHNHLHQIIQERGHFRGAPKSDAGRRRKWRLQDLVLLKLFVDLTNDGMFNKAAGRMIDKIAPVLPANIPDGFVAIDGRGGTITYGFSIGAVCAELARKAEELAANG